MEIGNMCVCMWGGALTGEMVDVEEDIVDLVEVAGAVEADGGEGLLPGEHAVFAQHPLRILRTAPHRTRAATE